MHLKAHLLVSSLPQKSRDAIFERSEHFRPASTDKIFIASVLTFPVNLPNWSVCFEETRLSVPAVILQERGVAGIASRCSKFVFVASRFERHLSCARNTAKVVTKFLLISKNYVFIPGSRKPIGVSSNIASLNSHLATSPSNSHKNAHPIVFSLINAGLRKVRG
jgi:hypothetical protein